MTKDRYVNFRLRPEAADKARWLQKEIPTRYETATGVRPPEVSIPKVVELALTALVGAHKGDLVMMSAEKFNEESMTNMAAFAAVVLKAYGHEDVQVLAGPEPGQFRFVLDGETGPPVDVKDRQLDMLQ